MAVNGIRRVIVDRILPPGSVAGAFGEQPEARGGGPMLDRALDDPVNTGPETPPLLAE